MSTLKLLGFTAEEQQSLQSKVKVKRWEAAQVEELSTPRPEDEVWVVCVSVAAEFLQTVFQLSSPVHPPKAVLWVPSGKDPLPLDDWWEGFHAQLREENADDCAFLERISRCARALDWSERVEDIPADWFAELTGSPRLDEVDDLPFNEEERRHLTACADCREEAYERLQRRAEMRWEMLCPAVDEITEWLETEQENRRLEAHVVSCGLCQETVKRQAWLWEGAGLLTAKQVETKLAAVGMATRAWLVAAIDWSRALAKKVEARAALLAEMLCGGTALQPAWRTAGAQAEEAEVSLEDLKAYLSADGFVMLSAPEQWLHLMIEGDAVLLRAGKSPANQFERFRVEFRRGEEAVVTVEGSDGIARLTPEHFHTAQQKQADRLVILV